MSSVVVTRTDPTVVLASAQAALDLLHGLDLTGLGDDALLGYWRELERLRRRIPAVEHGLVLEAQGRGLPEALQLRSVAQLLRGLLRLDPGEAAGRVRAAEAAGPRRTLTGDPLPPIYPAVAAAQAAGEISERQARVVVQTVDKLPDSAQAEHGRAIEAQLVEYCGQFDPVNLAKLAERILAHHDPDGRLEEVEHREKQRDLTVQQRVDGSSKLTGELTAEATELLLLHLDAFARPKPETDGVKDPRTAGQRRHDALLEALKLNLRARQLPTVAGVTATIVMTMTVEQYETQRGWPTPATARSSRCAEAMRMTAGEYRLMNVVIDKTKGITAYSSPQRLHTDQQRLARAAIDGGCTFPDCPAPPGWCEMDHVIDYAHTGPIAGSREQQRSAQGAGREQQQKVSGRRTSRAAWMPPGWIDPEQKPRYNQLHRPLIDPTDE